MSGRNGSTQTHPRPLEPRALLITDHLRENGLLFFQVLRPGYLRRGDPKDRLGKMDADHQTEILLHFRVAKRQRQVYIRNRLMAKTRLLSHLSRNSRTLNRFKFRRAVQHAELAYVVTY